ncbi:MAG TPA: MarR family transcriptional regulator [Micromonosporaceae bacterium]|nr:MarR family transcriptional regulator [Micromonosporaceae bacterium]
MTSPNHERDEAAVPRDEAAVARDEAAVARFVERLGASLTEAGMARMPARVFATLLASEHGRLTAAELAHRLHASPAAISGAVRALVQLGLAGRERQPGTRRDAYRVYEDVWQEAILRRDQMLARLVTMFRDGVVAVGGASPAGARLSETVAFFEFMQAEMPLLMQRWKAHQASRRADR